MDIRKELIEELSDTKTPLEAEKVLEKISETDYINDTDFMNKVECLCDFRQFHLEFHYENIHKKANIKIGQEVFGDRMPVMEVLIQTDIMQDMY